MSTKTTDEIVSTLLTTIDPEELVRRVGLALSTLEGGTVDGSHHRFGVIDAAVMDLLGSEYGAWVEAYEEVDEYGDKEYTWGDDW